MQYDEPDTAGGVALGEFDLVMKTFGLSLRMASKAASVAARGGVMAAQAAAARQDGRANVSTPAQGTGAAGRWLSGLRYRQPQAGLPPESQVVAPDRSFAFGLPWPWEQVDPSTLRDVATGQPLEPRDRPDVSVEAPRTDGRTCLLTLHRLDAVVDVESLELGRALDQLAYQHGGQPGRPRRLRLGGERAVMLAVAGAAEEHHLLISSAGGRGLTGALTLPVEHAQPYLLHLETVLATWQWYG